jgi:hypothetical protein
MRATLAAVVLLALLGFFQISSMRLENQTADEAVHLVSGYLILREGRFSLNAENPPLSKVLSALPLLFLRPGLRSRRKRAGKMRTT